jgi:predicted ribonuclease YlaK
VYEELDRNKSKEGVTGSKARKAINLLRDLDIDIVVCEAVNYKMPRDWDTNKNDNKIIMFAKSTGSTMVTGDYLMTRKCKDVKVDYLDVFDKDDYALYKGVRGVYIDTKDPLEVALFRKHQANIMDNEFGLISNEYLILYDKNDYTERPDDSRVYKKLDKIMRWDGENLRRLKLPPEDIVTPYNDLQACALDLLYNPDIKVKVLSGTYGGGKTFLATKVGLHMIGADGIYSKMLTVREVVSEGHEIGYLPGGFEDKTKDFFTPIEHSLDGGFIELAALKERGKIEQNIPYFMKGTTYNSTCILLDEASDLTLKQLKLVGTRVGERSCITFVGDYRQSVQDDTTANPLVQLCETFKGKKLFGMVCFSEDVRSEASKLFADLL